MIDVQSLREIFAHKLRSTGDLDRAFVKAVWVAYKQGLEDAEKALHPFNFDMSSLTESIQSNTVRSNTVAIPSSFRVLMSLRNGFVMNLGRSS